METKANILITELFDTELIGEGALPSYEHAHQNLVQVCLFWFIRFNHISRPFSDFLQSPPPLRSVVRQSPTGPPSTPSWWNRSCCGVGLSCSRWRLAVPILSPRPTWSTVLELIRCATSSWAKCLLAASRHWVLSAPCSGLTVTSTIRPFAVLKHQLPDLLSSLLFTLSVDFSQLVSSSFQSHSSQFVAQSEGQAQVVLSWWDLEMDPGGSIVCTMAPSWTYTVPEKTPVRHRIQWKKRCQQIHLLITWVCFSGGTTGCRVCTSCQRRAGCPKESSWVWPSVTMTTVCGTACRLTGNSSATGGVFLANFSN